MTGLEWRRSTTQRTKPLPHQRPNTLRSDRQLHTHRIKNMMIYKVSWDNPVYFQSRTVSFRLLEGSSCHSDGLLRSDLWWISSQDYYNISKRNVWKSKADVRSWSSARSTQCHATHPVFWSVVGSVMFIINAQHWETFSHLRRLVHDVSAGS